MSIDDAFDEGQAQTSAFVILDDVPGAVKPLKHVGLILRRYADPAIGYPQDKKVPLFIKRDV